MKSLEQIKAENDAVVAHAEAKRKASLKRLKQRIARRLYDPLKPSRYVRRDISEAIDAWDAAERKRGAR